ncbi:response regulator receiver domain protein [Leptospira yanagawae serovar Saopaulo str. Sao Paulo = ATCC 700523]|uniref:Response regulator receiver domain protein n=1 Tax=Leptospira yanagawae serovar Saopaulo str. Sao Paulo = ATCC 700523 TaxID=1249483 RepID=A0A5E8HI34_9LEPT|nr:response regulator [Leptospira yanagawae]EOQ90537.1 response regulator receiver domain protein [Leptospira yanagawae serovar Saopaulo str. Sao Paulo = ATCC 700523]
MNRKILIIDDSAVFRKIISVHLKNANFDLMEAGDGLEGLKQLETSPVDLIVSDMNMPNMDGISFIKKVKENAKFKFTPIIMLTTESQPEKKQQGMDAGAKAWLTKPFSPEELLDTIAKLLP